MLVYRIKESAKLPTKAYQDEACYDLYACIDEPITFKHGEIVKIPTGLKIDPGKYHLKFRPRSGLAAKFGIDVLAGQIDRTYRGELIVILTTDMDNIDVTINPGDKIAQFKLELHIEDEIQEVFTEDALSQSDRGEKGFGSSGS